MPIRTDFRKILVLGSGPIQIGQGCEFDYSGTQACVALRELGFEVALVNSNPATIMTDTSTADRVYIEPLTLDSVISVLERERPDALLPTVGGQVALNLFLDLERGKHLERLSVRPLGVSSSTVILTEDRRAFRNMLLELGFDVIRGDVASTRGEAQAIADSLHFPLVVRSSFTLGGAGGGVVRSQLEFEKLLDQIFAQSNSIELVIEESIMGWKEYELEVMRDSAGTFVVVCGVENINPMGVHTGDSITCAPCLTLTDLEYQKLRDQAQQIFARVGMETGGANIQFAVHPGDGRIVVVEMNPRVSRSSALVSKATGYPIARLAAKLAVGLTLAELKNEITEKTTAAFEPSIDYVAVKIPRWDFGKYKGASQSLGVQMKSVGEVLAFGRTFRDAFQKAWRSLELGFEGWPEAPQDTDWKSQLTGPTPMLFPAIKNALKAGLTVEELHLKTGISKWFLIQFSELVQVEKRLSSEALSFGLLRRAKQDGFTHKAISKITQKSVVEIKNLLSEYGIKPTFKMVDSCAGEFNAVTPYYYKTFDDHDENQPSNHKKVVILGSGPNRIGQGVEFDYSCVHAVRAAQREGYEVILVNCNPETVSTDHLVSDKLFIEPLHEEDVLDILRAENPDGVLLQFGGQSPLKLAPHILESGFRILGTSQSVIDLAENRNSFGEFVAQCGVNVPAWSTGLTKSDCLAQAKTLGYPLLVRPSYVLGGRAMRIVWSEDELHSALDEALEVSEGHPVLLDRYLCGAIEYDIDLVCDGQHVFIPAIMEHVEEAGIHSGDSASVIPCLKTDSSTQTEIKRICSQLALKLGVKGLLNIQLALHAGKLYVLEVNPRSSRSVPFVSKATGLPLAEWGARVALGVSLAEIQPSEDWLPPVRFSVKAPVFPFHKFPGVSPRLGPEMRSIGEVMGVGSTAPAAFAKAFTGAGWKMRAAGSVLVICEKSEMGRVKDPLMMLRSEFGMSLCCLHSQSVSSSRFEVSEAPDAELLAWAQDPLKMAHDKMHQTKLSMVVFVAERANGSMLKLADSIGALTTQYGVPFIDSAFALEAWVMAFAGSRNFESPSPIE